MSCLARRGIGPTWAADRISPDRARAHTVPEPREFVLDAAVAPGRILVCQAQHQSLDLVANRWTARSVRVGPSSGDQAAVPGQQGGGGDDPMLTQVAGEQPGQSGQDCPVRPGGPRSTDLTAQHRHFVAQDQDLHIFGRGAASEQSQPAEHRARSQIQQSEYHGSRSFHDHEYRTKPQVIVVMMSFGTLQAESDEFSLDPAVAPGGVVLRQA